MSDFGDELAGLRTPWWRFMLSQEMRTVDKGLCDGQDFATRLGEVDLLDGKADGR